MLERIAGISKPLLSWPSYTAMQFLRQCHARFIALTIFIRFHGEEQLTYYFHASPRRRSPPLYLRRSAQNSWPRSIFEMLPILKYFPPVDCRALSFSMSSTILSMHEYFGRQYWLTAKKTLRSSWYAAAEIAMREFLGMMGDMNGTIWLPRAPRGRMGWW